MYVLEMGLYQYAYYKLNLSFSTALKRIVHDYYYGYTVENGSLL